MGNCKSCFYVKPQTVKLIDGEGHLKKIQLPITAAEIMLQQPGYVISNVHNIRTTLRFTAVKADEELVGENIYMLVPLGKLNSKVSKSELDILDCICRRRGLKLKQRTSSKVLPMVTGGDDTGVTGYQKGNCRQWRPVLETICEGN